MRGQAIVYAVSHRVLSPCATGSMLAQVCKGRRQRFNRFSSLVCLCTLTWGRNVSWLCVAEAGRAGCWCEVHPRHGASTHTAQETASALFCGLMGDRSISQALFWSCVQGNTSPCLAEPHQALLGSSWHGCGTWWLEQMQSWNCGLAAVPCLFLLMGWRNRGEESITKKGRAGLLARKKV